MTFDDVLGQPAAISTLRSALAADRLGGSYLFEGPSGVGKVRAALALALAVICPASRPGRGGCGTCEICRRVLAGNHPDVRTFAPRDDGHGNLQVDYLRTEILPFTQFAPFEAKAAFLIFPDADVSFPENHPESANAMLKTLEEPRPNVRFVLASSRPDRLLPTIRSRCQSVRFARLGPSLLDRILQERGVPVAARAQAIALADGRADRAIAFADAEGSAALFARAVALDEAASSGKPGAIVSLAEELAKDGAMQDALDTLVAFYRDVAVAALGMGDEHLAFRHEAATIRARASTLSAGRAAARAEKIRETVLGFERNANPQIALDALLFDLGRA